MSKPQVPYHWSSPSDSHHAHAAYSAAGSYRQYNSSVPHHNYQYEQWRHDGASSSTSPPEHDQLATRTAIVSADGTTVYAATGRKRKRLQKACVACHKAKRRCDGGLPCSNCDFSGRTCCYSDATGKMVVPTARVSNEVGVVQPEAPLPTAAPSTFVPPPPQQLTVEQSRVRSATVSSRSPFPSPKSADAMSPAGAMLNVDDIPPERRREMISIFFSQLHPFSCVVDEIVFLRDLSTSEIPSWLLLSMFALSARFQQGGSELERERRFLVGERYARTARTMLHKEDHDGSTLLDRPDLDLVLALTFLAAHEFGMGRLHRALSYSNNAVRTVAALQLVEGAMPPSRNSQYGRDSIASSTRRATCERLVLLTWTLDMTISALALQSSAVRREDVSNAVSKFGTTGDQARDEVTRSFIRLTEIVCVFAHVLDDNRAGRRDFSAAQDSLAKWAESLGVEYKFDDYNMKQASRLLEESEATPASHRAWFWAQMHLMAECSVFLMQANKSGMSHSKPAYDNIQLILSNLGIAGRRNLFAIPALVISTEFNRPTPDVLRWSNTARQCWMMTDRQVADVARLFVKPSSNNGSNSYSATHVSPGSDSLVLPRLSSSSVLSASSRGSAMSLPSLERLPLPALRLSPILSKARDDQDARSDRSRSSIGSNDGAAASNASSPSTNDDDDSSVVSPKSMPLDLYHSHPSPLYRNPSRGSVSPSVPQQSFAKVARDSWNPISSLRGEKRPITAISL